MANFLSGTEAVVGKVSEYRQRQRAGAERGTLTALANVLTVSNARVPHESGALQRDGAYGLTGGTGSVRGGVSYGRTGDTPKYAERQHEDMSLHHDSGRSAKFLEHAFNTTRDENLAIIQQAIKGETGA